MKLILRRTDFNADGIFGELLDEDYSFICVTLEHAYFGESGYIPKLPPGNYSCKRGDHLLEGHEKYFETFEVMNVPGHWGILFHVGNYNKDSSGCILVGTGLGYMQNGGRMIVNSKKAFAALMSLTKDLVAISLVVEDVAV